MINPINPVRLLSKIANKVEDLPNKVSLNDLKKQLVFLTEFEKIFWKRNNSNNEIKDIMKVIKSLKNGGILLKGTTRKITTQEGGFLNFLRPLMTAGLPLKNWKMYLHY